MNPNKLPDGIKLSFILLAYNQPDITAQRLVEFRKFVDASPFSRVCELVFVDNGSTADIRQIKRELESMEATLVTLKENRGFSGGFNAGFEQVKGEYVILWSNDVEISNGLPRTLLVALQGFEDVKPLVVAKEIISYPAGWNQFDDFVIPYPAGYFLVVRRLEWLERGGFDERFNPHDYEDVDVGMWAMQEGGRCIAVGALPVQHMGPATIGYNPERRDVTNQNRAKFAEKWDLQLVPETL